MTDAALECAHRIAEAFVHYNAEFRSITRRAPLRFDDRDTKGSQRDAVERIELYDTMVNQTIAQLREDLGERAHDRELWARIRSSSVFSPREAKNASSGPMTAPVAFCTK